MLKTAARALDTGGNGLKDFRKTRRKRIEAWLTAAMFLFGTLTGCGSVSDTHGDVGTPNDGKLKVVTTLFPYYDFTRQIAGDAVDLSMVIPAGQDSHSFEPTPADIRLIQNADLLICNGGAMEQWVSQVVASLDSESLKVITMMDYVDTVEEEIVEGMEDAGEEHHHSHASADDTHDDHDHDEAVHADDDDHDHDAEDHDHTDDDHDAEDHNHTDDEHDDDADYEIEYDEHIWTSPVNAMKITQVITDTLQEMDPADADIFAANAEDYLGKLENLDQEFRDVVNGADLDLIVMADKFPLRYFADTYGLRYRAAFSGCASDTEPSAKTIAYLIDKVREEQIPAVYYLELSSHRVAEIISEETGAKPLLFHSCHNVTRREFDNGVTYLELMEQNVVIKPTGGVLTLADELRRSGIGYLPQQTPAQKDFPATVQEVVISGCLGKRGNRPFYSMEERKLAAVNMEKLGITDLKKSCYRDLSGGQKQRTLIARALCATDKLLILDEPITGLDPASTQDFYAVIRHLNRDEKVAVLMVSHDIGNIVTQANKILQLKQTVQFYGTVDEYKKSEFGREFLGGEN